MDGSPRTPAEVVGWFGAVQAQDWPGARWAVGQRSKASSAVELDTLLTTGAILRTHVLRPTWHLVTPHDIRWMLDLTAARVRASTRSRLRELGITDVTTRATAVMAAAIERAGPLTRLELQAELAHAGIDAGGQRMPHLLGEAELDGVICSGGLRGARQTYALLDTRAPAAPALDRDEALAELAARYFQGHGPAQVRDLAWWSGLTVGDARRGIAVAGDRLQTLSVDGVTHVDLAGRETPPTSRAAAPVQLLSNWDEYVVAYADRRLHVDERRHPTLPPSAELLTNTVAIGGELSGTWRRVESGPALRLMVRPWRALSGEERSRLGAAAEGYGRFIGRPVTLAGALGDVS